MVAYFCFLSYIPFSQTIKHFNFEPLNVFLGESQEFVISFSPDHASENYADELCINVNGEVSSRALYYDFK